MDNGPALHAASGKGQKMPEARNKEAPGSRERDGNSGPQGIGPDRADAPRVGVPGVQGVRRNGMAAVPGGKDLTVIRSAHPETFARIRNTKAYQHFRRVAQDVYRAEIAKSTDAHRAVAIAVRRATESVPGLPRSSRKGWIPYASRNAR